MNDDLISRQATIDAVENCEPGEELFMIESLPSIDAVPVVRCKDCKYYKENTLVCSRYGLEDDDYCSWAERKEE